MSCLLAFRLHTDGFTNADLRVLLAEALGVAELTPGQMTYQLRRLKWHGFIARIPHTFRYQLTEAGLQTAVAYTLAHDPVLRAGLDHLTDPAVPSQLRRAYETFAARSCLAA